MNQQTKSDDVADTVATARKNELSPFKRLLQEAARALKGYAKRLFMARSVVEGFDGMPSRAERELGWNRGTVSKGLHELRSGVECVDGRRGATGRKPAEAHLPNLLTDIRDLVDSQSQTDARFRTRRLYTRMSAAEVRRQLHEKKGYQLDELPSEETLRCKLNMLGYHPVRVQKTQVKKRSRKPTRSSKNSNAFARKPHDRKTNC